MVLPWQLNQKEQNLKKERISKIRGKKEEGARKSVLFCIGHDNNQNYSQTQVCRSCRTRVHFPGLKSWETLKCYGWSSKSNVKPATKHTGILRYVIWNSTLCSKPTWYLHPVWPSLDLQTQGAVDQFQEGKLICNNAISRSSLLVCLINCLLGNCMPFDPVCSLYLLTLFRQW